MSRQLLESGIYDSQPLDFNPLAKSASSNIVAAVGDSSDTVKGLLQCIASSADLLVYCPKSFNVWISDSSASTFALNGVECVDIKLAAVF